MSIPEQDRDDVLLRRAAKGDQESFTLLYRRHQAALYRFALRMVGNAWAAEEVVQDVFLKLSLLSAPQRETISLIYLGGLTQREVARERIAQIEDNWAKTQARLLKRQRNLSLAETLGGLKVLPQTQQGCLLCHH